MSTHSTLTSTPSSEDLSGGSASAHVTVPSDNPDRAAILSSMEKYLATLRTNDADAVASWWTSDAIYMPAGIPTLRGSFALNRFLKDAYGAMRVEYHAVAAEDVLVDGNLAVVAGGFEETLNPKNGAPSPLRGRYILVWQRQSDGVWKIARGIGTDWQEQLLG